MSKVALSTLCMNAGENSNDLLIRKKTLEKYQEVFDEIHICDGKRTIDAEEFYSQFNQNIVKVHWLPWDDDYVGRYRYNADKIEEGSWILHLDSDEIMSQDLFDFIKNKEYENLKPDWGEIKIFGIPCVLYLSETEESDVFYPSEINPKERKTSKEEWWYKYILYKKVEGLEFRHCGSHVIPGNKTGWNDGVITQRSVHLLKIPYYHLKSLESFVINDVLQAFVHPEGQRYSPVEAAMFKMLTKEYATQTDFKKATEEGRWSPGLMKFAADHINDYDRPISRLAMWYWSILEHKWPYKGWYPLWKDVKKYVQSPEVMSIFEANKKMDNFLIFE